MLVLLEPKATEVLAKQGVDAVEDQLFWLKGRALPVRNVLRSRQMQPNPLE
jgi:hypothetical protein